VNIEADYINEEQFELGKKLIKKMNFNFDSRNFENPTIQKFYSTLQAIALGESEVEKTEDVLRPDKEGLKRVNGLDTEFRSVCGIEGERKLSKPQKTKNEENGKKNAKRKKGDEMDEEEKSEINESKKGKNKAKQPARKRSKSRSKSKEKIEEKKESPSSSKEKKSSKSNIKGKSKK